MPFTLMAGSAVRRSTSTATAITAACRSWVLRRPLYMSPEAIQSPMSVDARSDLYGLGAVGYFLLTGRPVFEADGIVELCRKHVDEIPVPPSRLVDAQISNELENAVLSCLEKSRAKRPQTARDFSQMLQRCPEAQQWSTEMAEGWWGRHERGQAETDDSAGQTQESYDQTMVMSGPTRSRDD